MYVQFLLLNIRGEVSKGQSKAGTFTLLPSVKDTLGIGKKFTPNLGRKTRKDSCKTILGT